MNRIKDLNLVSLNRRETKDVKGACVTLGGCGCACAYRELPGGASTYDNTHANLAGGLSSPQCPEV